MSKIISIVNQKGGVGKTTTAINLSAALSTFGKKVLLIDLDSQGNSSRGYGIDITILNRTIFDVLIGNCTINQSIKKTTIPHVDIIPSNLKLSNLESEINKKSLDPLHLLSSKIKEIKGNYDFVLIDCPPSLGIISLNALIASNSALIPVQCEYFAMEAVSQMLATMRKVQNKYNHNLEIEGIVFTMYDSRTRMAVEVTTEIRKLFKEKTFTTAIPRNIYLPEAALKGIPITIYKPKSSASIAYLNLAKEILDHEVIKK